MINGLNAPALPEGQWPKAAKFWPQIGAPLRPGSDDIGIARSMVARWAGVPASRYLILGVTPEYHGMAQDAGAEIQAIDRTPEMVDYVWPGRPEQACIGDWRDMPWQDPRFDVALCDGGLQLIGYPDNVQRVASELQRVLVPGGLFIARLFSPPATPEQPDQVLRDLAAGGIPNLNVLKLRLGMSMQTDAESGTALDDIWNRLHAAAGPWPELARALDWPLEHLQAIEAYRGSPARMHYFTPEQTIAVFAHAGFRHLETAYSGYLLGDRCPTLCFRRD